MYLPIYGFVSYLGFTFFATFHICFASVPFILSLFHMLPFNSLFYVNLFALSFTIFASKLISEGAPASSLACTRILRSWKRGWQGAFGILEEVTSCLKGPSLQLRLRLPQAGGRCHHPHRGQPALGGSCHCSPASAKLQSMGHHYSLDRIRIPLMAEEVPRPHPRAWELWPQVAQSWKHHLILPSHEWVPDMELQEGLFFRKTRSQAKVIQFRPCQVQFWAPPPSDS